MSFNELKTIFRTRLNSEEREIEAVRQSTEQGRQALEKHLKSLVGRPVLISGRPSLFYFQDEEGEEQSDQYRGQTFLPYVFTVTRVAVRRSHGIGCVDLRAEISDTSKYGFCVFAISNLRPVNSQSLVTI